MTTTTKKTTKRAAREGAEVSHARAVAEALALVNANPPRAPRWRMFGDGLPLAVAFEPAPPDTVRNPVEAWVWYAKAQGYPGPKAMCEDLKASGVTLRIAEVCCCGKEVGHA